jgi:hypothetical protein
MNLQAISRSVRLWIRPRQVVLWGGRPGIDRQAGGTLDLALSHMEHAVVRLTLTISDRLTPSLTRTAAAMESFAKTYTSR